MTTRALTAVFAALALVVSLPAWSVTIVFTNGDANTAYIVDTEADSFVSFDISDVGIGYPLAVTDRIVIGDRDDEGAVEYDLDGNPTGNTFTGGGNFSQLLDGTTNGIDSNFGIECCADPSSVTIADLNWEGQQVLFGLPAEWGSGGSGITYDTATGTLWINDFDGDVRNFALDGTELSGFSATDIAGSACCMAYDEQTDTLWIGQNSSNLIYNYQKDGTLIETVTITGWSPGNMWGAEIAITGAPGPGPLPEALAVPSMSVTGLLIMVLLLFGFGLVVSGRMHF